MSDAVMVPRAWLEAFRRDTDPTEPIADNGGTVWDMFCHEASAMLAASPSVVGWEDISTAPKDGTLIHVWAPGYEWPETVLYEDYPPADQKEIGERGYWRYAEDMMADACDGAGEEDWTHWMPLPPPPSVSTGSRPQEAVPTEQAEPAVVAPKDQT